MQSTLEGKAARVVQWTDTLRGTQELLVRGSEEEKVLATLRERKLKPSLHPSLARDVQVVMPLRPSPLSVSPSSLARHSSHPLTTPLPLPPLLPRVSTVLGMFI